MAPAPIVQPIQKYPSVIEDPDTIKNVELWFKKLIPFKDISFEYINDLKFLDNVPKENYKHRDFLEIFDVAFRKITEKDIMKIK